MTFIIILKSVLRFLNLAVRVDFADDIIINKIKGVTFIKENFYFLKYYINLKLNRKL